MLCNQHSLLIDKHQQRYICMQGYMRREEALRELAQGINWCQTADTIWRVGHALQS